MANSKIDRIDKEILKTREKISEYQNKLRSLEAQKAEAENLQIVQLVRSMHLNPAEFSALLAGGGITGFRLTPMQASSRPTRRLSSFSTKPTSRSSQSPQPPYFRRQYDACG